MPQRKLETELVIPQGRQQWWLLCTIKPWCFADNRDIFEVSLQWRNGQRVGAQQVLLVTTRRSHVHELRRRHILQVSAYDEVVSAQGRLFRKFTNVAADKLCEQKLKTRKEQGELRRSILSAMEDELQLL